NMTTNLHSISINRHTPHTPFFFLNDTPTTEIYTLSLHDALPISRGTARLVVAPRPQSGWPASSVCVLPQRSGRLSSVPPPPCGRSEEHTSELQSRGHLVCRLLLEKKKNIGQDLAQCVHDWSRWMA